MVITCDPVPWPLILQSWLPYVTMPTVDGPSLVYAMDSRFSSNPICYREQCSLTRAQNSAVNGSMCGSTPRKPPLARRANPDTCYDSHPNGSLDDIAGICNIDRNIVGMMPHPERASESVLGSMDGLTVWESLLSGASA